jgi:heme exporter protein B
MLIQILTLIRKEFLLEYRQKAALSGVLLYLGATIFVCYLSFSMGKNALHPITWNALLWIILLFISANAIGKSFLQEREGRLMYFYILFRPEVLILAKMLYNAVLMFGIGGLGFLLYALVLGNPIADMGLFALILVLGAIGLGFALTFIAAIAAQAQNSATLMAVLGFPITLPLLLMLIGLSKNALDGLAWSVSYEKLLMVGLIDLLCLALGYLLFPYIWRS